MATKSLTINNKYERLKSLLAVDNRLLLGVGRTTSWPIETAPPDVNPNTLQQDEVALYLPVTKLAVQLVATSYTEPNPSELIAGSRFAKTTDLEEIVNDNANMLYVSTVLKHNNFPESSYRSFGLYEKCLVSPTPLQTTSYTPEEVTAATLFYLEFFQSVEIQPNVEESVKLVIRM